MNTHKHFLAEDRVIFFAGPETSSTVEADSSLPTEAPEESKTFDPKKRKEEREKREAEETDDAKKEENELQTIENQLDGIDTQELREAEAFIHGARETLKTPGQKEIYDEGVSTLTAQEKIAIYKDVVISDESMSKYTAFDSADISESSLSFFAENVITSSLEPIDLGELPKMLEGTVEAMYADWRARIGEDTLALLRQAHEKMKQRVSDFLNKKDPKNAALLKEVTQFRNKKEKELKIAMGVFKLGDAFFQDKKLSANFKSDSELRTVVRSEAEEMIEKMDGQHGIKIENTSSEKDDEMSLLITPKNEAQYKKILEIAKKQHSSNIHETKAFMKKPSIEIKKIDPNEMKIFIAKLRDAKLRNND
ncbi:MAG TPA: hypothetical protein VHA78_00035 [Candidatus Peribacteraceae bacterium]|nr:hypothetical protein [Candidatus Peribacteraceae bacterium]